MEINKVNQIIQHPKYKEYLKRIELQEENRIFCKHDMVHFLDVCRIAEILWLKEKKYSCVSLNTEMIYATGLLHDIGRWQEYETGIRHEIASAKLAADILNECNFGENEIEKIVLAIENHRNKKVKEENSLSGILYRADKMSRPCFSCKAEPECDWDFMKKNMQVLY